MAGVLIRHTDPPPGGIVLVPVLSKPFFKDSLSDCPLCRVIHPCKTVHLWLNDKGQCLVSEGVLKELRLAGMPNIVVEGHTKKPPPLRLGGKDTRAAIDYANRTIRMWNAPESKGKMTNG